jgi:hypothetical protein
VQRLVLNCQFLPMDWNLSIVNIFGDSESHWNRMSGKQPIALRMDGDDLRWQRVRLSSLAVVRKISNHYSGGNE